MYRYFSEEECFVNGNIIITGDDVKHIKNTLRYKVDDEIVVVYQGIDYISVITDMDKTQIKCKVFKKLESNIEANINITLYQGLPKKAKMEKIIQQNVEIGVKEIVPIITDRTVVKITDKNKENKKVERWQKICKESAKQSKRNIIPKVSNILEFKDVLTELKNRDVEIIVPYEDENNTSFKEVFNESVKNYAIVIGPEGGFDKKEIEELKLIGAKIITLGPRILRTETAGIVTSTIILYESKELGGA